MLLRKGHSAPSEKTLARALRDPATNIRYGSAYLAYLRQTFKGRKNLYINAYNMGAGKLRSSLRNGVHPREYSDKVLAGYSEFSHAVAVETTVRAFSLFHAPGSRFPAADGRTFAL